jgi:hypothetical protein
VQKPPPGRLVVSIIYSSIDALADGLKALERKFGRVQFETLEIPCSEAELYREEMGKPLSRRLFSFDKLVDRSALIDIKKACHKIEPHFADIHGEYTFRTINLDPGILSPDNLIMTSHREYNHRMYVGDGVYGELTLVWSRNQFVRLPWTCLDFYHDEAIDFFIRVRQSFEIIEDSGLLAAMF